MRALRGLLKTAVAAKAFEIIRREASKPENQAKAREMATRVAERARQAKQSRPGTTKPPQH
jgi:hypothetical protein